MATQQKATNAKDETPKHASNSKGMRKGYDGGVVGWQVYLQAMRMYVNVNQYASAISADKKLIDISLKGIAGQDKYLANECKPPITVPGKLAGRRIMALKAGHPSFADSNTGYSKALAQLVALHANKHANKPLQGLIASACKKALKTASAKAKITNRLKKRIGDLV